MTKSNTTQVRYTFEISNAEGELVDAMNTMRRGAGDAHKQARNFFAESAEVGDTMDVLRDGVLIEQWEMLTDREWDFVKLSEKVELIAA